jgi:hypothetical protein
MSMLRVHVRAASLCPFSMFMSDAAFSALNSKISAEVQLSALKFREDSGPLNLLL